MSSQKVVLLGVDVYALRASLGCCYAPTQVTRAASACICEVRSSPNVPNGGNDHANWPCAVAGIDEMKLIEP